MKYIADIDHIIKTSLNIKEGKVLIITHTKRNKKTILRNFIKKNKCVPDNVTVQEFFPFLMQHGVKPYQGSMGLWDFNCTGVSFRSKNAQSDIKELELDVKKYYFTKSGKIYSYKMSKFAIKCNQRSDNAVINRISNIYTDIIIDKFERYHNYDLVFLQLLCESKANVFSTGDMFEITYDNE